MFQENVFGFYSVNSSVIQLNSKNFEGFVLNSDELWMVEFYAPWCRHCKNLAPEYEKTASVLKGIIKVGAVDMTTDGSVAADFNIPGYPSIKFFGEERKKPIEFDGERTSKDLSFFAIKQAQQVINKRLGLKINAEVPLAEENSEFDDENVIDLNDDNFDVTVFATDSLWFVDFYAPWCSHCNRIAPEWALAASYLKGSVKFGKIDATKNMKLAKKYDIKNYPTLKIFLPGAKQPEDYNGVRDADFIINEALVKLDKIGQTPSIPQLVSDTVLKTHCDKDICIIVFLPHIFDSSAAERNRYISVIQESSKNNRGKPLKFLWTQAGDFPEFEKMVGIGFGFPSLIGLSLSKSRFVLMKSAFVIQEVEIFIKKLINGNILLAEYKKLPKFSEVSTWDGLDHQPEISNDDL